jgi:hypothetical protein
MRKALLIIALLLLVCGCDPSTKERVAAVKAVIDQAVAVSQSIDVSIADVNQTVISLEALAKDPNVPAETIPKIEIALAAAKTPVNYWKLRKQFAGAPPSDARAADEQHGVFRGAFFCILRLKRFYRRLPFILRTPSGRKNKK